MHGLNWGIYLNSLISDSRFCCCCCCCSLTCGLLASANLHCRKNSLRFPQAMKGSSTMGFSPSSVHTWLIGSKFLKVKRKTEWGTGTVCERASIMLTYISELAVCQRSMKVYISEGHSNHCQTVGEEVSANLIDLLTSRRRKRKVWADMTTIFFFFFTHVQMRFKNPVH